MLLKPISLVAPFLALSHAFYTNTAEYADGGYIISPDGNGGEVISPLLTPKPHHPHGYYSQKSLKASGPPPGQTDCTGRWMDQGSLNGAYEPLEKWCDDGGFVKGGSAIFWRVKGAMASM